MIDLSEGWLRFIGLPDEYPDRGWLISELNEAIYDAVKEITTQLAKEDPVLAVMLDDRYAPWTWAKLPAGTLPAGTRVRWGTFEGRTGDHYDSLHPDHPPGQPPYWASITWNRHPDRPWDHNGPGSIAFGEEVHAEVPVPFDAAPLRAEICGGA